MTRLVLQRLGQTAVVLFGVTVIVFAVLRIMPGDPVSLMFSGDDDAGNVAAREEYAAMLGLDRPLPVQYLSFLEDVSQGDLGKSFRRNVPVSQLVGEALPLTIELTLAGLFIAIAIAVPVAILSALKQNSFWDRAGTFLALIGVSMPSFWQGIMLILILAVTFPILPVSGVIDIGLSVERVTGLPTLDSILTGNWEAMRSLLAHLVLPAFTLGTGVAAQFTRVLRSSLLEVKHQDFIDALRARGLKERTVVLHMLRNALPTTAVVLGMRLGALLGGTLVIETVFSYPGMGFLLINAINQRDFPVVQGVVLVMTLMVIIANLLADIAHGYLDPRVKLVGEKV